MLENSGLPGPRGNIELGKAVADEGNEELFFRYLKYDSTTAPTNVPQEFLAFCGVLGLGRLLADGRLELLGVLKKWAADSRWRIREGVAMALQRFGESNVAKLVEEMQQWSQGNCYEQRAAAAALCEPVLLKEKHIVEKTLEILDVITASILERKESRADDFIALKKGLGYCWSVAIAACPEPGKVYFEKWLAVEDERIHWILKENIKKNRLQKMDSDWVDQMQQDLGIK